MDLLSVLEAYAATHGFEVEIRFSSESGIPMDDDDDMSISETPVGCAPDLSPQEKQRLSLQTYLDSVPYDCESIDEMEAKLEIIAGKIFICAQARNWLALASWDGMLQCWLLMRYPILKTTRAKLVRLYYELCLLPGIEPRVIRSWADILSRLLSNKSGSKRKLEAADMELAWQPLWRVLYKELWPKGRLHENSRNAINILLYVAEHSKRYYPANEIPNMLNTFLPLLTRDSVLMMVPVITSFLPPTHTHLYLPALFKLWEASNSSVIDGRLIELAAELSEEHVAGKFGKAGEEGGAEWRDIGIWSEDQWTMLVGKALGSMNVPVGTMRVTNGSGNTSSYADSMADKLTLRIKKSISRHYSVAKMLVYSMAVDGLPRAEAILAQNNREHKLPVQQTGFLAGSRALDSLDRLITSIESFFHPSNSGTWTLGLTTLLGRLTTEFSKRWTEEEQSSCTTPVTHRLTPSIRRTFVTILRTPAFLAMFSKDPISMSYAQGALSNLAILEPSLIIPELLERAYGGLEIVNETHRTTAVLSMLSGISRPLVSEKVWFGGQKHIVPLLELCIPGIDLNDPAKTICTTMFIISTVQHIMIGDLSGMLPSGDLSGEEMNIESDIQSSDGSREPYVLSRDDERALVRDSTASFADWVISLFRRILCLYENLPEEGGKQHTTGGKQEESVLRSIKGMLDVVCVHLSDHLFDLVLNLVFDYATTNAKSNAVRAFGQLVACLARAHPERTIAKFLPYCIIQIEDELKHGASNVPTTSSHAAVPSDTNLHWNLSILRGCLGYGGAALLMHRRKIISLISLLVEKTKSERGYHATGRLLTRVLRNLAGVYPLNLRFVNTDEWDSPDFERSHSMHWGKLYEVHDVRVEWHVPSTDEVSLVMEILDQIATPALNKMESLINRTATWDNADRNDFCRYLDACRSVWSGLPTFYQEIDKDVANPCLNEDTEVQELTVSHLDVKAGFTLTDPQDPRYQIVAKHRTRFGDVVQRAASALRRNSGGEDHIDAVIGVTKAIDVFLLEYGIRRAKFDALQKDYYQVREKIRTCPPQKDSIRLVFVKRAEVYHSGRVYLHALYRRRSEIDDRLLVELVELSLSPYSRVRRQAQTILHNVCSHYVLSTRIILPILFDALGKGNDVDRMKGALYILWHKGTAAYALSDERFYGRYLIALLECQHEEKPSIQILVNSLAKDCLMYLSEEAVHTGAYSLETPRVQDALRDLETEFSPSFVDQAVLTQAVAKTSVRVEKRAVIYNQIISSIVEIALRPKTHWRYVQMAARFLYGLLRRDLPTPPDVAKFFMENSVSPQPTIRVDAQRAVVKLLTFIKIRTYAKSSEELWLEEWHNPLEKNLPISDPSTFLESLERFGDGDVYVDKIPTGFLTWTKTIKSYSPPANDGSTFSWESPSQLSLRAIREVMGTGDYFTKLGLLWSQESNKKNGSGRLRRENVHFIKSIAKMFEDVVLDDILIMLDPILSETDRFKQRAGAELLSGLLRGSKHWSKRMADKVWSWTASRLDRIFAHIKPDTLTFWDGFISDQLIDWDPRRNKPLVDWILALPLEFNGDSTFAMNKTLTVFGALIEALGPRCNSFSDKAANLFFDVANTGYAEVRTHIAQNLHAITRSQWFLSYPSNEAFLQSCRDTSDPLRIRSTRYANRMVEIMRQMRQWKQERLPPPRVNQSEYDKVGLTLLHWMWLSAHSPQASLVLPYIIGMMPELFRMSELQDNQELQEYSSSVLYVLSAITTPIDYVPVILQNFTNAIKLSKSWRIRRHALPALVVFFYRNLAAIPSSETSKVMEVLLDCLADENVEVREMASKVLSGIVRCSQRQIIVPLKNRFVSLARKVKLPARQDPTYAESLRSLHSAILGLCALIESFPYSVEPWMPSLAEVLAPHASDPAPISTTIRKCASEFKKTHQDTWHKDQQAFDEDQLQSLSTMLVGTSYYA